MLVQDTCITYNVHVVCILAEQFTEDDNTVDVSGYNIVQLIHNIYMHVHVHDEHRRQQTKQHNTTQHNITRDNYFLQRKMSCLIVYMYMYMYMLLPAEYQCQWRQDR